MSDVHEYRPAIDENCKIGTCSLNNCLYPDCCSPKIPAGRGKVIFTSNGARLVGFYTIDGPFGLVEAPTSTQATEFVVKLRELWPRMHARPGKLGRDKKYRIPVWSNN